MKKLFLLLLAAALCLCCACSMQMIDAVATEQSSAGQSASGSNGVNGQQAENTTGAQNPQNAGSELVLLVAGESPEADWLAASAWRSMQDYAATNQLTCSFLPLTDTAEEALLAAIAQAATNGAKLLVCPGEAFASAIYQAKSLYPELYFVLLDAEPHSLDYADFTIGERVLPICFDEGQMGYLAGYSAVSGGYYKLGFLGGLATDAVQRYGYGFLCGAEAAAAALGQQVSVQYAYSGAITDSVAVQTLAGSWYANGTDLIFTSPGLTASVAVAAENSDAGVIGVEQNLAELSMAVLNSSIKDCYRPVWYAIDAYHHGVWQGGATQIAGLSQQAVALAMGSNRMGKFTKDAYELLLTAMSEPDFHIYSPAEYPELQKLPLSHVQLTVE